MNRRHDPHGDPYAAQREFWRACDRAVMQGIYDPEEGDEPDVRQMANGQVFHHSLYHAYITGLSLLSAEPPTHAKCDTPKPTAEEMRTFPYWRFVPCTCGLVLWRVR